MEKVHQAVDVNGLQIPIPLMRQYGLEPGSGVTLELEPDGIRVVPAKPERAAIESRALRYLLAYVGDAAAVQVIPLPGGNGWQVDVSGAGLTVPAGTLYYSVSGALVTERSTPPAEIRRVMQTGSTHE